MCEKAKMEKQNGQKRDGGVAMKDKKMALIHFWEAGPQLAVITSWRQEGLSLTKVAKMMRLESVNTLVTYARESEKIRKALEFGKWQALAIADQSLMNQVRQGNMDAIKYFTKHNRRSKYAPGYEDSYDNMYDEHDEGLFELLALVYGHKTKKV
jgi:hypothetical protein